MCIIKGTREFTHFLIYACWYTDMLENIHRDFESVQSISFLYCEILKIKSKKKIKCQYWNFCPYKFQKFKLSLESFLTNNNNKELYFVINKD